MNRFAVVFLLVILCAGCGGTPRIDATSDETFQASVKRVRDSLDGAGKEKFEAAVRMLTAAEIGGNLLEIAANADGLKRRLQDRMNGKTAAEVIADADAASVEVNARAEKAAAAAKAMSESFERDMQANKARADERAAKVRADRVKRLSEELAELKKAQAENDIAQIKLALFDVESAEFAMEKQQFGGAVPTVKLVVRNGTEHPVARAYFSAKLTTAGRSVPWVDDGFNYAIQGGIEPGETQTWELTLNRFSDWGRAPADGDLQLAVEPFKLEGADGKTIAEATFTSADAERLTALEKALAEAAAFAEDK